MKRFIEGVDRSQSTLFPDRLEDWIGGDNAVRVVDVFVDELDLSGLGFDRVQPLSTGRPGYHPSVLLKLYIHGYLNRIQSSRRLEREAGRNVEVMWLTRRRTLGPPLYEPGKGADLAALLDHGLPPLRHQGSLHHRQAAPPYPVAA